MSKLLKRVLVIDEDKLTEYIMPAYPVFFDRLYIVKRTEGCYNRFINYISAESYFINSSLPLLSIISLISLKVIDSEIYFFEGEKNFSIVDRRIRFSDISSFNNDMFSVDYFVNYKYYIKKIDELRVTPDVCSMMRNFFTSQQNLSKIDFDFLAGESFLATSDVYLRKNDTCFDNISLKELVAGKLLYEEFFKNNICHSLENLKYKRELFSLGVSMISGQSSNLQIIDGYPAIYKFYSALFFYIGLVKHSLGFIASAFMFFFRSLETYCDGFLIMNGLASIGDFYNKSGQIKGRDVFLLKGHPVNGFGAKWGEVIATAYGNQINSKTKNYLSDMKSLRNNFLLAHGDSKVNNVVVNNFSTEVRNLIFGLEASCSQVNCNWKLVLTKIENAFRLNPYLNFFEYLDNSNIFSIKNFS
ncbi:hypothetical protein [Shewanella baltica]|uniref:hypothetical protein n=1 Tax=Shewanella baltica TaxID=62322 RepID=UPI000E1C3241|nr:hypothetical protein [Shewanella baltica]